MKKPLFERAMAYKKICQIISDTATKKIQILKLLKDKKIYIKELDDSLLRNYWNKPIYIYIYIWLLKLLNDKKILKNQMIHYLKIIETKQNIYD